MYKISLSTTLFAFLILVSFEVDASANNFDDDKLYHSIYLDNIEVLETDLEDNKTVCQADAERSTSSSCGWCVKPDESYWYPDEDSTVDPGDEPCYEC